MHSDIVFSNVKRHLHTQTIKNKKRWAGMILGLPKIGPVAIMKDRVTHNLKQDNVAVETQAMDRSYKLMVDMDTNPGIDAANAV